MIAPIELWDVETADLVGTYPTVEAALAVVHNAMLTYGLDVVEPLALQRVDARGRVRVVGSGAELCRRAEEWRAAVSVSGATPFRDRT